MTKVAYDMVEEVYMLGLASRKAYGVAAYAESEYASRATIIKVQDISSNKNAIKDLVDLCNRLELSPIHLYDVIEDFLGQ